MTGAPATSASRTTGPWICALAAGASAFIFGLAGATAFQGIGLLFGATFGAVVGGLAWQRDSREAGRQSDEFRGSIHLVEDRTTLPDISSLMWSEAQLREQRALLLLWEEAEANHDVLRIAFPSTYGRRTNAEIDALVDAARRTIEKERLR